MCIKIVHKNVYKTCMCTVGFALFGCTHAPLSSPLSSPRSVPLLFTLTLFFGVPLD